VGGLYGPLSVRLCNHGEGKEHVLCIGVVGNLGMYLGLVVVEHKLSVL
jgi:hypothetical protein